MKTAKLMKRCFSDKMNPCTYRMTPVGVVIFHGFGVIDGSSSAIIEHPNGVVENVDLECIQVIEEDG